MSCSNTPTLTTFFKETLDIKDVSWVNLISELKARQGKEQQDVKVIQDIYLRLQEVSAHMEPKNLEKLRFEMKAPCCKRSTDLFALDPVSRKLTSSLIW